MSGEVVIKREPQSSVLDQQQSEKKLYEGRKYPVISADTIKTIAEANGIATLNQDVAAFISNDASYRLYEVIHSCSVFLRLSRRRFLTAADLAMVLRDANISPIFGAPTNRPIHIPEADVFVMHDERVILLDLAFRPEKLRERGFTFVSDSWIASEPQAEPTPAPFIKQEPSDKPDPKSTAIPLPAAMLGYFTNVGSALLGSKTQHMQEAVNSLRSSEKLSSLGTPLLNLLVLGLQELPRRRLALLSAATALLENSAFWIVASIPVYRLISALLMCALEPCAAAGVSRDEEIDVKLRAASVLGTVMSSWCKGDPSVLSDVLEKLYSVLYNGSSAVRAHLGALAALSALGPAALERCLWPPLAQYLTFLESSPRNPDTVLVEGAILDAAECLYHRELRNLSTPSPGLPALHRALSEAFGEALCARFGPVPPQPRTTALALIAPIRPPLGTRHVPHPTRTAPGTLGDHFDLPHARPRPIPENIQMHFAGGKPMAKRRRAAEAEGGGRQPPSAYVTCSREIGSVGRMPRRPRSGPSLEHVLLYVL